ncbi:outer membrane beta-barrel family protein [Pedobacter gandavensis]|uniref:Outer membrane beta-barrel protein n=1 Tax=Pedobacter gandavensis TaxID=2679963 RepID=A0ABR6F0H0_9SPHI|nr:outer membrane beta-barrel family protein [Pedobacter gandavensis]MBB2151035.1 outer membrane beta-barrel protein [Pedobacter gandavensis]
MKLKLLLLFLVCYCPFLVFSQSNYEVRGVVTDTAATYKMVNTTITVLNAKDSTLVKFARTGSDGAFKLLPSKAGKFILLVSYPGYADYVENFSLDSLKKMHDFGKLNLVLKSTLLQDVIIKGNVNAIKMKGDTTEFNAAAYVIQPNAKVEDLLKQLPGITIDKDGKITAQGQAVNKVLVDGEEFFGDDPTLVTKNLRGDMVDKVQLFDKTSDQAAFTGIDDGQKAKTINIKLKEDKKQGYFGKVDAGGGTEDFYSGQAMVNAFKGKKKVAAYGTIGNNGKTGLSWSDNNKFGTSNFQMSDDGMYMFSSGGGDDGLDSYNGQYNGEGLPKTLSGGGHFSNKWNKDKENINTNYKVGAIDVTSNSSTKTQNNLPEGSETSLIRSNAAERSTKHLFRQKLDATYTISLDSNATIKVGVDGLLKNNNSDTQGSGNSKRADSTAINNSLSHSDNKGDQRDLNANVLYTQKLKKKGRTFSLNLRQSNTEKNNKGNVYSLNQFFDINGEFTREQVLDQYKTSHNDMAAFSSNATYTEPITKTWSVVLNYGLNISQGTSVRKSYNKNAAGQYTDLDMEFSNDFKLNQISNQGGAVFNFKKDKTTINFGTKISDVNFKQKDGLTQERFDRKFTNWNPSLSYKYAFSQMKSLRFDYYGNTTQPSINQLQPVKVNNDPLNIYDGNPDLRPSYNSRINANFGSYKVMSGESIWFNVYTSFTSNAIANQTTIDNEGKSTHKPINIDGKTPTNFGTYINYYRKIKGLDIEAGFNGGLNGGTSYSMVNQDFNTTNNMNYNGSISISKRKEKKYDAYISAGPTYTISNSSLQKEFNDNGWSANGNANFTVYLPGKIELGSDAQYEYRAKTKSFNQSFERFIWNANISKKFFKAQDLKLSLAANDLLNQNTGFDRSASSNLITQRRYNTIGRYFMASLTWDFNKMGGGAPKQ